MKHCNLGDLGVGNFEIYIHALGLLLVASETGTTRFQKST